MRKVRNGLKPWSPDRRGQLCRCRGRKSPLTLWHPRVIVKNMKTQRLIRTSSCVKSVSQPLATQTVRSAARCSTRPDSSRNRVPARRHISRVICAPHVDFQLSKYRGNPPPICGIRSCSTQASGQGVCLSTVCTQTPKKVDVFFK